MAWCFIIYGVDIGPLGGEVHTITSCLSNYFYFFFQMIAIGVNMIYYMNMFHFYFRERKEMSIFMLTFGLQSGGTLGL